MSAQLDFPPLPTEQPSTAIATQAGVPAVTLKDAALVHFSALDAPLRALAERYRDVAFDVSTTKGLDAAKKARQDLRENGRFAVQRAEAAFKAAANDAKKAVEAKADELVAIVRPVEDSVDAQIKVREAAIEQERQERAIAEAARQQKHRDAIAVIAGYVAKADGLPSARIQAGLEYVRNIDVGADVFEDFAERAAEQKAVTIERLEAMLARTLAAEEAAQRAEAQRIENERVAAELAEQRRQLAEQAEALRRAQMIAEAAKMPPMPPAEVKAALDSIQVPEVITIRCAEVYDDMTRVSESHMLVPAASEVVATPEGDRGPAPTIKLGDICLRLGFTVTAAFVTETLGVKPAGTDKRAVLFAAADFNRIVDALIKHLTIKKEAA